MSSKDAQKSEVHDTTDDASSSPSSTSRMPTRGGRARGRGEPARQPNDKANADRSASPPSNFERGAADADIERNRLSESAETTAVPKVTSQNKSDDRAKTFPPDVKVKRDESDLGGPIDIDLRE